MSSTSSASMARAMYRQYSSSSTHSASAENLPPRTLARLAREVKSLHKNPPEGVRLVVDSDSGLPSNLGELMAELQGPQGTPYEGKYFLLKIVFGQEFPNVPPRGFFLTKLYHPNVDMSTGAICVNTLKKDWTADTNLLHVLAVIRCLLIVPFPESSLNDEAGKLFMESYEEYSKRARLMADVHGRSTSCAKMAASSATSNDASDKKLAPVSPSPATSVAEAEVADDDDALPDMRVLKNASDNPLRSNSNNTKKVNKGPTLSKLSKKKSLKRL